MLSRFFISRPVFASVLSIILVLMGVVAATRLPVAQYPELAPPIVRVEATYPGASAKTIADTLAQPIEQEVNGVDGMIYFSSTASDGRYALDVSFKPGTNVDLAAVLVQNRVNIAEPKLPEEARRLGITTRKQSTSLAGVIALFSDDGKADDVVLSNFLNSAWRDEFARIPGVGAINVLPSKEFGMRVWLDPARLKARGLTVADVNAAIRAQNVQVAAGAIGRPPAPKGTDVELVVTTRGRLSTPEEFGEIIVKSTRADAGAMGGGVVRVRDVARVELGARDYSTIATFNGKPNAVLVIYQLPGANLVELTSALSAKLATLTADDAPLPLPPGAKARFFYDASMFIRASIGEVAATLIEAFILVFIVVFVFLQSLRTTLIPALTIPVSLVGALAFLAGLGFSINMLTMFGMVLAIGIVVDDAIVVVENVERNMTEHGLPPREATIRAMDEIFGPVVAITLVLMSVFIPAATLPGITGEMYRQFALTIAASTALSAVCALTLSPALCALILKAGGHGHGPKGPHAAKPPGNPAKVGFILLRPFRFAGSLFNRAFDALASAYALFTRWSCKLAVVSLLALAAVFAATFQLVRMTPTGFVPGEDLGFVVVAAALPDGASLERTESVIREVGTLVSKVDGVKDVVTLSGFSVIQGQGTSYGNCWIVLEPWHERYGGRRKAGKPVRGVDAVMNDIRAAVAPIQESQLLVFSLPAINGLGNTSGFDLRVQARDGAAIDADALQAAADDLVAGAFAQSGILAAWTTYRAGVPQLYLDVDREKAIRMDVPLESVFETLQTHLGSAYVNDFNRDGRTYQVTSQADAPFRLRADDILRLEVRTKTGMMVPLGTLLSIRDAIGPGRVERYNMYTAATLNGIPAPGTSSGDAMTIMEGVARDKLPRGAAFEWSSMSYQERLSGGQGTLVFALGILLVYLILAAQYESWSAPLAVVLSVPLVVTGAMALVYYRALDNNVFTQIGLVLLIGLGAKNAILIVEFARAEQAAGKALIDAVTSAAKTRLRPILMTSFAFILGVLPLVRAEGAGAASRQALGTAVFGGMVGATILGLLFIPVLYYSVARVAGFFARRPHANPAAPPAAPPPPPAPPSPPPSATPPPATA